MRIQKLLKFRTMVFPTIITVTLVFDPYTVYELYYKTFETTSSLFIIHYQVIRVQSSIKVTNQCDPPKVGTLDGPQT